MDATPTLTNRFWRGLLLAAAMLLALLATTARAQQPPAEEALVEALQIIGVTHSADGTLTVSAGAAPPGSTVERFDVFVDSVQTTIRSIDNPGRDPAAIVIAIDTSGSMAGAPIESAKDAALRLIERLEPADAVAIVSFAAEPQELSGFTTNRSTTATVLATVSAEGDTSLYDAVTLSSALLEGHSTTGSKVLVLLSDGQDTASGGASGDEDPQANPERQVSLDAVGRGSAEVHAFALGEEADEAYLAEVANVTGGTLSQVATDDSLGALFESLGSRLAATFELEASVPPLSRGQHRVELVAFVDGVQVTQSSSFQVLNHGLLSATVDASGDPELIAIDIAAAVPAELFKIEASIDGSPLVYSNGQVYVDSWALAPGNYTLEITASVADKLAYSTTIEVEVPTLEAVFEVAIDSSGLTPELVIEGRAQGPGPHTLRVLAGGEELLSSNERDARVAFPTDREVTVQFVTQSGSVLAQETIEPEALAAPSGGGGGFSTTYAFLALAVIAVAGGGIYLLRKRRTASQPKQRMLRRFSSPRELPGRPQQAGPLGVLHLVGPDGSEKQVTLGLRPVTIGSSPNCDIVIEGDDIQPLHARVSARGNGEFQIHGLAAQSAGPFGGQAAEEWVVLQTGESIGLGGYQITITETEREHAESA